MFKRKYQTPRSSPLYGSWISMVGRCTNPNRDDFQRYGAIGITVCQEWLSFDVFVASVGDKPSPAHSIDRIDSSRGYEPGNVRWATAAEQARNRKTTRWLTHDGRTQCLIDWAKELGICKTKLAYRLRQGWTIQQVLSAHPYARNPSF